MIGNPSLRTSLSTDFPVCHRSPPVSEVIHGSTKATREESMRLFKQTINLLQWLIFIDPYEEAVVSIRTQIDQSQESEPETKGITHETE